MNAHDRWLEKPYQVAEVNHAALQVRIEEDAKIRLQEWKNIEAAGRDAHGFELLLNDIDLIISTAAQQMDIEDEESAMLFLGFYLAGKVRRSAIEVATHVVTE